MIRGLGVNSQPKQNLIPLRWRHHQFCCVRLIVKHLNQHLIHLESFKFSRFGTSPPHMKKHRIQHCPCYQKSTEYFLYKAFLRGPDPQQFPPLVQCFNQLHLEYAAKTFFSFIVRLGSRKGFVALHLLRLPILAQLLGSFSATALNNAKS